MITKNRRRFQTWGAIGFVLGFILMMFTAGLALCALTVFGERLTWLSPKEYCTAMFWIISIFGITLPAICVWLTLRIINRKERWAKWTLAAAIGLPVLYVATFGPVCWIFSRVTSSTTPRVISFLYSPIIWAWFDGPAPISKMIGWYANAGAAVRLDGGQHTNGGAFTIFKPQRY